MLMLPRVARHGLPSAHKGRDSLVSRTRLILCFATVLAACSGGGGDNAGPVAPWGRLRGSLTNTGLATGRLEENNGNATLRVELGPSAVVNDVSGAPINVGGVTTSTPIIGTNGLIYLGTTAGVLVTTTDAMRVRLFDECVLAGRPTTAVGSVSGAAAINTNGDVVFGDDSGRVFAFHDDGMSFTCLWVFPQPESPPLGDPIVSSAVQVVDLIDFSLVTAFIGVGTGYLEAINNFGTQQWRFPSGTGLGGPLSSSPATDGALLHITAADGFLYSIDRAGRLQHQARFSLPMVDTDLLPSPMVGSTIYTVGTGGRCAGRTTVGCLDQIECGTAACEDSGAIGIVTALTQLDAVRWRFATDAPIAGSAAFALQVIDEPVPPTPTSTPSGTPTEIVDPSTPTATPTRLLSVVEGVVFIVDIEGTVYGVKDATGDVFAVKPTATATPTPTSTPGANETPTAIPPDSKLTKVRLAVPASVTTSPVLSSDLFVVFGTEAGALNAIRLDFDRSPPCQACGVSEWEPIRFIDGDLGGGTIDVGDAPVLSDPIIDRDGKIYLTAGDVVSGVGALYAVGSE